MLLSLIENYFKHFFKLLQSSPTLQSVAFFYPNILPLSSPFTHSDLVEDKANLNDIWYVLLFINFWRTFTDYGQRTGERTNQHLVLPPFSVWMLCSVLTINPHHYRCSLTVRVKWINHNGHFSFKTSFRPDVFSSTCPSPQGQWQIRKLKKGLNFSDWCQSVWIKKLTCEKKTLKKAGP